MPGPPRRLLRELLIRVASPTIVGGLIYILFRPRSLILFRWFDDLGLGDAIDHVRMTAAPTAEHAPELLIFCLPNALWLYAFTRCMALLWRGSRSPARFVWLAIPALLSVGSELGQLTPWVPGTFDALDVVTSVAAVAVALIPARPGTRDPNPGPLNHAGAFP